MKIIQVGNYPQNEHVIKGGTQASIYGLVTELVRMNHVVDVVSLPDRACKEDTSVALQKLRVNYFSNPHRYNMLGLLRFRAIARHIRAVKPDVCHLHGADTLILLLYIYCRIKGIAAVVTIHGLAYIEKRNAFKRKKSVKNFLQLVVQSSMEFLLVNLLKEVIVDTKYVADSFRKVKRELILFRLPEMHIIPQGINEQYFKLADNYERNMLLSVGSINERKGHLYLVKAVEKAIADFPNLHLHIIGNVRSAGYYESLINYISSHKLEQNINIHTGLNFSELTGYYTRAHLFLLHSEEESQGIVFCEAMACGKPVVATNSGGIPDVVMDKKGGLLSVYGDSAAFAENIKSVLSDEQLRKQFSEFNKQHAIQYSWRHVTEQILELYDTMLSKSR